MDKVVPNCNKLITNNITSSFGQIRSYTTTNCLKEKELLNNSSNNGFTTPSSTKYQNALNLNDYEKWNAQQVKSVLIADQSLGGVGLSIEEVELLDDFNGSFLANIVQNIKEKDLFFALNKLEIGKDAINNGNFQLYKTCKTIVYWVNNTLIPFQMLQEINPKISNKVFQQVRIDPKYEYLRNLHDSSKMKALESLIGTNIDLPILNELDGNVPIDFDHTSKFLLTRQGFELLNKVIKKDNDGHALYGPYGMSKSYTMYLIACYAIVNSIPLLYVPKCKDWVECYYKKKELGANEYLRNLALYWNYDIISRDLVLKMLTNPRDVIDLLKISSTKGDRAMLLFDEHHEVLELNENGIRLTEFTYFRNFNRWHGITSGTMTVYCGNKLERYLSKSVHFRRVRVTPLTQEEFKALIKNYGLNVSDENKTAYATGRIPGELKKFVNFLNNYKEEDKVVTVTDNIVRLFIKEIEIEYEQRLNKSLESLLSYSDCLTYFYDSVENLFTLGLKSGFWKGRSSGIDGEVYDEGLLYKTHFGQLYFINEAAKRVLFNLYCQSQKQLIIRYSDEYLLKQYLLIQEYNYINSNIQQRFNVVNFNNFNNYSKSISYTVNTHQSLDINDLSTLNKENYLIGTTAFFVPETNFSCFSYLIIQYEEKIINLYFKQPIVSTIDARYNTNSTDLDLLLDRNYIIEHENKATPLINRTFTLDFQFSLLELIIHGVIGNFGDFTETIYKDAAKKSHSTIAVKRNLNLNFKLSNNELNSKLVVGDLEINWYYIYESSILSKEQSTRNVKESGILYRNREDIEKDMKITFENRR
ncbi:hypothetical protein ABK040_010989 [Willaertia magna]